MAVRIMLRAMQWNNRVIYGTRMHMVRRYAFSTHTLENEVNEFIKSGDIVMFSKTTCGFCMMAKSVLKNYSDEYKVMELNKVDSGYGIQDYLWSLTGSGTVPQIFIHEKYVGGCSEIFKLHSEGELQKMIDNE
eukprot:324780_1